MNQLKEDHFVYFLFDKEGIVRYVGHGRGNRFKDSASRKRSSQYREILQDGGNVKIMFDNLSKAEAIKIESELLNEYLRLGFEKDGFNLINKNKAASYNVLKYEEISEIFELSESSETGLVWKNDAPYGTGCRSHIKGNKCGSLQRSGRGYGAVHCSDRLYSIHRVIWVLANKQDLEPEYVINHIDSNPRNNNPSNLEKVSQKENIIKRKSKPSETGVLVVCRKRFPRNNCYSAFIVTLEGERKHKSFSVDKYGEEEAFRLACEWREKMVKEHRPKS